MSADSSALRHSGKRVVLSGAAGGLGQAVASRFLELGATVVCVDLPEADPCSPGSWDGRCVPVAADVTDERAVDALHDHIRAVTGPVDMVFNVAGILRRRGLADTGADDFRRVLDVNVLGAYLLTRAFAPDLIGKGWGRVVNVGSIASVTGYPYPSYAASKAAVANLTRSLLHDFAGTGVTVNTVCPGAMETPMMDPALREHIVARTPARRVVPPAEVAAVIDFLAGEDAGSINGATIVVDGGATAAFSYAAE